MTSIPSSYEDFVAAANLLSSSPDHRVLRRLNETTLPITPVADDVPTRIGCVVDVETTGLAPDDTIIELAAQRFKFDAAGRITALGTPRVWRQDPGRPLDPAITRLTGLSDADLAGQMIDDGAATAVLKSANIVIAHNASGFDCARLEARLPDARGLAWCCSMAEIDYRAVLGFEGRSLGYLLAQAGWFYEQHRAMTDILALLHLLAHQCPDGSTVLGQLVARAERPTVRVEAIDTPFAAKDALKQRGYRWQPDPKLWWIEVADSAVEGEQLWLQRNGCLRPAHLTPMTWFTRHR